MRDAIGDPSSQAAAPDDTHGTLLRAILSALPDPLAVVESRAGPGGRREWRIVDANDAAAAHVGIPRDRLVGARFGEVLPEHVEEDERRMARVLETGAVERFEVQRRGRTSLVTVFRVDGRAVGRSAVDVTEQHRVEAATRAALRAERDALEANEVERERTEHLLREQLAVQDQLAKVAACVPGVVCSYRVLPDGRASMPFSAPGIEDLYGVPQDVLAEDMSPMYAHVHPEDVQRLVASIDAARRAMSRWHCEWRYVHPYKGLRWIEGRSYPVAEPGGATLWHGYVVDVTDRKLADVELRRLAAAVEQTPAAIMITDAGGIIQYANPAFERVSGWSRAEVAGKRANLLKSGRHDAAFYRDMWSTISAGRVWKGRIVNRARDGRTFTEDAVIAPVVDDAGAIRNYVAVKRNVTDELGLQEALAQSQRLDSVGRLAGGIAHDFNNILTVILSCADAIRDELGAQPPQVREDLEEIRSAAVRAAELTRQLLTFARRQPIEPVPLDLNRVLAGSERLLRRVLGEDLRLQVGTQPDLWAVRADPGQLEQVVLNLAVNARDAMPEGGVVSIEAANVVAGGDDPLPFPDMEPGGYVRLVVTDSGSGMTEEVRARAFEPFFTTKGPGGGTGLGLSTVYGIVKQSGGFIRVESAPGRGSTFEIFLPRTLERPREAAERVRPAAEGGTETVVLVEDDPQVRAVAARALLASGYRVLVASGADDALHVAETEPGHIDLLVTDVVMPGVGGKPLAEEFARRRPGAGVLFVSGYAESAITRGGAVQPGVRFLPKPFTPADLVAKVRSVLDEDRSG